MRDDADERRHLGAVRLDDAELLARRSSGSDPNASAASAIVIASSSTKSFTSGPIGPTPDSRRVWTAMSALRASSSRLTPSTCAKALAGEAGRSQRLAQLRDRRAVSDLERPLARVGRTCAHR